MPYFENREAKLYYKENGQGNPLILLHGASWDMRQWHHQVEYFSQKYRIITLDARGHGKSSLPPGEVPPNIFRDDVISLMSHLKIEKATICGLSMGGHVAIQLAIYAPDKVSGLILIGTPCSNKFNKYERICVPINRLCLKFMPMSLIAWVMSISLGKFNPTSKTYIKDVVSSLDHNAFNRIWKAVTCMESRAGLANIKCPTLILIGEYDSLTRHQQQFIHQSISDSHLVTINHAHHGTNLDNPAQVEKEIDAFLLKYQL